MCILKCFYVLSSRFKPARRELLLVTTPPSTDCTRPADPVVPLVGSDVSDNAMNFLILLKL